MRITGVAQSTILDYTTSSSDIGLTAAILNHSGPFTHISIAWVSITLRRAARILAKLPEVLHISQNYILKFERLGET